MSAISARDHPDWLVVRRTTTPRQQVTSPHPDWSGGSRDDLWEADGGWLVPFRHCPHAWERSMSVDVRIARAEASAALRHATAAPRVVRRLDRRRRRKRQTVRSVIVALVAGLGLMLGTAAALMPGSVKQALVAPTPVPTPNVWAADASGCLTNLITGAVACPIVTEGNEP